MPVSESVETPPKTQAPDIGRKVRYHRQALENIEMHRSINAEVAEDAIAEEKHLDALVALGEKLTEEEIHRKAIHVAMREAADRKEPLTEVLVAQVEERLKSPQK